VPARPRMRGGGAQILHRPDGVVDGAVGFPTLPPRAAHEDAPPPAVQDEDVAGGSRPIHPSSTSTAATGWRRREKIEREKRSVFSVMYGKHG
jgi:hypothetical protein